ncbi:MAG: efflux RND transporter periplasmic adaptor subunit [Phycisphaeraceae bacterium]|nr:efflux RND transporter periplasmic adaptor subunit [Phycisphaeraceae bacterium]
MKRFRFPAMLFMFTAAALACGCDRRDAPASADEHDHEAAHAAHDGHADHEGDASQPEAGEHSDEVTLSAEAAERAGIRLGVASRVVLKDAIRVPARIAFNGERMAHVGSPVSGRVSEIKVKLGDHVEQGDPLLVLQSLELGEAQSDFLLKRMGEKTAEPGVELARTAHERARALYDESQGIALTEVLRREGEHQAAVGSLLAARSQATAAENRLHLLGMDQQAVENLEKTREIMPYYVVRAPLRGRVIEREATLGELVSPEREALLVLADMSTLWVLADVSESQLHRVTPGAGAEVLAPALSGGSLTGTVTFISPMLSPGTRTASVRIEVPGDQRELRPGMFAQAVIHDDGRERSPALAIPEGAAQRVEGRLVVFVPVEGEPNTYAAREVSVGPAVGGMLPVLTGLQEGQSLVISGGFILKAELGKGSAEHQH